jgi:hydrogenase maturation protease
MLIGTNSILVLGYGNPGREDDGLGPAAVEAIAGMKLPGVSTDADYQLNIEDAADLAAHQRAVFVDASRTGPEPFELKQVSAAGEISFTSHAVSPESVLAICEDHFGHAPQTWLIGIRGYSFEMREGLTPQARENLQRALLKLQQLISDWTEKGE